MPLDQYGTPILRRCELRMLVITGPSLPSFGHSLLNDPVAPS